MAFANKTEDGISNAILTAKKGHVPTSGGYEFPSLRLKGYPLNPKEELTPTPGISVNTDKARETPYSPNVKRTSYAEDEAAAVPADISEKVHFNKRWSVLLPPQTKAIGMLTTTTLPLAGGRQGDDGTYCPDEDQGSDSC